MKLDSILIIEPKNDSKYRFLFNHLKSKYDLNESTNIEDSQYKS